MAIPPYPLRVLGYRLSLEIDFAGQSWKGSVQIDLSGGASEFTLDSSKLKISQVRLGEAPVPFLQNEEKEQLLVQAPVRGSARAQVDFEGAVEPGGLMGLYRSKFDSSYILTTQCEPTGAHKIFPCVDRPDQKAPLELEVVVPEGLEVVSNTGAELTALPGGRARWSFAKTPPMATYLFYLGVGRFDHLDDHSGQVAIRALTPPGRSEEGRTAIDVARRSLEALSRYYQLDYPLPKLDLIAVPEFPFGAMENWEAIAFRELQMLIGPKAPAAELRFAYHTIAHEVAHQWFGNLVTPYWWSDIWLNESFATFLEHKIVEEAYPELNTVEDMLINWTRRGLVLDSLASTHSVQVPVPRAEDIHQAIDLIAYTKGASVLRMIEGYLGAERFRAGVGEYLRRHAWKNARSEDLWAALQEVSGEDVTRILRVWVESPGLPVIRARLEGNRIALEQTRFSYEGSKSDQTWPIPMVVQVDGQRRPFLFEGKRAELEVPAKATVHLNADATGFYRTLYDAPLYDRLLAGFSRRSMGDRFILFEDIQAFLLSGDIGWERYRSFVETSQGATDYPLASGVAMSLAQMDRWTRGMPAVHSLALRFLKDQTERLGLTRKPGENTSDGSLRGLVTEARAQVDPAFAREISGHFSRWEELDPDVREAVAFAYSSTGGPQAFEGLRAMLRKNLPESESQALETALAANSDPGSVTQALDLGLAGEVNRGNFYRLVVESALNPAARDVAWPWAEQHLDEVNERLRGTGMLLDLLRLSIPDFGLAYPDRVRAFFRDHRYPEATRGIDNGLSLLSVAEKLVKRLHGDAAAVSATH